METSTDKIKLYWRSGHHAASQDMRYGTADTPQEAAQALALCIRGGLEGAAWWAGYFTKVASGDPWFCTIHR